MTDPDKFLSDVRPEWVFWFCNGTVARNIYELVSTIELLDEDSFKYHVNTDKMKNDFAKWISEVLGDKKLAKNLDGVLEKRKYANKIRKRIKKLEKEILTDL